MKILAPLVMAVVTAIPSVAPAQTAAVPSPAASRSTVVEEILAVVNDDIITVSEYRSEWENLVAALRAQLQGEDLQKEVARSKADLLNMMITDMLLTQKAKALNLNVSEQVRQRLDEIKSQNNIASDEDFNRALQQQGTTYQKFRAQLEDFMLKQAVLYTEVDRSIALDDSQIVQYYKEHPAEFTVPTEYKIRAVYLASAGQTPEALAAARQKVDARLAAGEDFATVSGEVSDSPLRESKGDLGRFKSGELDKALETAVEGMKTGQVAPWIQTANGWYLMKLEERTEKHLQPFDAVKKQVEERLYTERQAKKREEYIQKMRKDAYVNVLKPKPEDLLEG